MYRLPLLLLLIAATAYSAEDPFPVGDLTVDGIYATRSGDPTLYCLLGANTCRFKLPHNPWTTDPQIDSWLTIHPHAHVIPVSEQKQPIFPKGPQVHLVYIWIEDGMDSLNVSLIREGRYAASAMIDMVEAAQRSLDEMDADLRQRLDEERAQVPAENRPHRLITDSDYAAKMQLVMQGEQDARRDKKGLWSDAGLKGRSPPKDMYLIDIFTEHSGWFHTIANLVRADPRFLEINQEPASGTAPMTRACRPRKSRYTRTCYKSLAPTKNSRASTGKHVSSWPTSPTDSSTMASSRDTSGHPATPHHWSGISTSGGLTRPRPPRIDASRKTGTSSNWFIKGLATPRNGIRAGLIRMTGCLHGARPPVQTADQEV